MNIFCFCKIVNVLSSQLMLVSSPLDDLCIDVWISVMIIYISHLSQQRNIAQQCASGGNVHDSSQHQWISYLFPGWGQTGEQHVSDTLQEAEVCIDVEIS